MKFYLVEFEDFQKEKKIVPSVPKYLTGTDNDYFERIELSTSIKLCVQKSLQSNNLGITLGTEFYVYSTDIKVNDIKLLNPSTLFNERLVYNAYENKEYWYTGELYMTGQKMRLTSFEREFDFAWTTITKNNLLNALNYSVKNKKVYTKIENHIHNFEDDNMQKLFCEITDILDTNNMYTEEENLELFLARDWKHKIRKIVRFNCEKI